MPLLLRGKGPLPPLRQPLSRWSAAIAIIAAFALDYWIDATTTSDLALLLFLIPAGLALYNFGPLPAYLVCFLAALVGQAPSLTTAARFLLLALLTALASRSLSSLRASQDRLRRLSELLPLCANCGQILCQDGQWRSLEQAILHIPSPPSLANHTCPGAPIPPMRD
jgi:hypothetical protein